MIISKVSPPSSTWSTSTTDLNWYSYNETFMSHKHQHDTHVSESHMGIIQNKRVNLNCHNYILSSCFNIGLVSHPKACHAHTDVTLTEVYHTAAKSFHVSPRFYFPQWAQQYWVKWCMIAPYQWEWLHKASEWSSCIMHLPAQYGCMLRGAEKENGPPGESHTGNTWNGRRRMRREERGGGNEP